MKQIFEQAIANVNSAYPSIYTKEDVVRLIQDIQEPVLQLAQRDQDIPPVNQMVLEAIKENLLEGVRNLSFEDYVQLELGYDNQIEINIDERNIARDIELAFDIATANAVEAPQE